MNKFFSTTLLLAALSLGFTSASAQSFVGFDDFSGADAKWASFFRTSGSGTNNGDLAFSGTQLDFSKGAGDGSYFLTWLGAPPSAPRNIESYTTNWIAEISVTSLFASVSVGGDFASVGIQARNGNNFSVIMLNTNTAGNFIRTEGTGTSFSQGSAILVNIDVRLRLSWDAATKLLVSSFSLDHGTSFTDFTTFTPDSQWTVSPGSASLPGFSFDVFVNSNATAAISTGVISLDNFTAVPEPSTYALLASGLGLIGLAVWRRRR